MTFVFYLIIISTVLVQYRNDMKLFKSEIPLDRQLTFKETLQYFGWKSRSNIYYWIYKGVLKKGYNAQGRVRFDIEHVKEVKRRIQY